MGRYYETTFQEASMKNRTSNNLILVLYSDVVIDSLNIFLKTKSQGQALQFT